MEPIHVSEGEARGEYLYSAGGVGVHRDLVEAVLRAWGRISPTGDPVLALRSAGDGWINSVDNIARMAALAVAEAIEQLEDR